MDAADAKLDLTTFVLSSIHDMKNSMGVMMAYLHDALLIQGDASADARAKTAQALYEAQRVSDHLVQLLALYKIEQAFYPFDTQYHVLADLVREVLARVADLAELKGIHLESDCDEEICAWFDYDLVFGVVVQALHNALRYGRRRVMLRVQAKAGGVCLRVEDDGPGFPDFLLAQGNARQRGISFATGNTGLGLYFAGVVAAMHRSADRCGRLGLENGGPLGGGVFILELP